MNSTSNAHATVVGSANIINGAPEKPKIKRVDASNKDKIFAILILLFSVLWIDFGLFSGFDLGHSIAFCGIAILTYAYTATAYRPSLLGSLYTASAAAIAVSFSFYSSNMSKFMLFWWALVLMVLAVLSNARLGKRGWKHMGDMLHLSFVTPFSKMPVTMRSLLTSEDSKTGAKKKIGSILIGIGCAVPALCIIIPLLSSSDAAFEALFGHLIVDNIPRIFFSALFGVVLFVFLFSVVFAAVKKLVRPEGYGSKPEKSQGFISSVIVSAFLSSVVLVYFVYLLSQLTYLINGFTNMTIAEYARRGFFEMALICAINVGLIALANILCRRDENGKTPIAVRLLCLFICVFSLVIVSTVFAKLVMYMNRFGLTQMRVYTSLFCLAAAIVIICVGIRMIAKKFPYFRVAAALLAIMSVTIALADVNTVIVRYNTEAYESGQLKEVDIKYLSHLGDGAVPYIVEQTKSNDQEVAKEAAVVITRIANKYGRLAAKYDDYTDNYYTGYDYYPDKVRTFEFKADTLDDFRTFNLQKRRALDALDDKSLWDHISKLFNENLKTV